MSDHIDQVAKLIDDADDRWQHGVATGEPWNLSIARALADAGRLATPESHAAAKASALRMAANALYGDDRANGKHSHPLSVASWLRELADRIEAGGDDE